MLELMVYHDTVPRRWVHLLGGRECIVGLVALPLTKQIEPTQHCTMRHVNANL